LPRSNGEVRLDKQHATEFAVDAMCRFLQVSRSADYDWLHRVPTTGEKEDTDLVGILQAYSKAGQLLGYAVSESFFHTLKTELIHHQTYQTRSTAKQAVFEYIEVFYNRERLHPPMAIRHL
jgi:transposase InsO family protein